MRFLLPSYLCGSSQIVTKCQTIETLPSYLCGSSPVMLLLSIFSSLPSYLCGSSHKISRTLCSFNLPSYLCGSSQPKVKDMRSVNLPSYLCGSSLQLKTWKVPYIRQFIIYIKLYLYFFIIYNLPYFGNKTVPTLKKVL